MEKPLKISQKQYKRLRGCFLEIEQILKGLEVREVKAPELSKTEKRKLKIQEILNKH